MKHFYFLLFLIFPFCLNAQTFQTVPAGIMNASQGGMSWGDFDADGDLDFSLSGYTDNYEAFLSVYRNKNGEFTKLNTNIPGLTLGSVNWGDYDNDSDLDLLVSGTNTTGDGKTLLYRNDNGAFTEVITGITGITSGEAIWMEYNNDSYPDILISGDTLYNTSCTKLYQNNGDGTFTMIPQDLPGLLEGCADAGDYDNDGDQDLFLSGTMDTGFVCLIYRNDNGTFSNAEIPLYPVSYSDGIFVDYDSDGDLDLIYMGSTMVADYRVKIYRNDGNDIFTCSSDSLEGEWVGRIDVADINNDGFPDLGITGALCCGDALSRIYMNNGNGHFILSPVNLPDLYASNLHFGDYDNDGDADFLLCGIPPDGPGTALTALYRNMSMSNTFSTNQPPSAPPAPEVEVDINDVAFTWEPAYDNNTPSAGLTYALRIGTTPGGTDILNPQSDPQTGLRKIYGHGNAFQNTSWNIRNLATGTYYCAVQALDHSCLASAFSDETMFQILVNGTKEKEDLSLYMYPNPARDVLHITTGEGKGGWITITDLTGKIVYRNSFTANVITIDLFHLPKGLYHVVVEESGKFRSGTVVY